MNKVILFGSCFLAVAADMMLVVWAKGSKHSLWLFIAAFLINACGIVIWSYSMRKGIESAVAVATYGVCTVTGCALLGYFLFGEHLTLTNIIGLLLALFSLILLSM